MCQSFLSSTFLLIGVFWSSFCSIAVLTQNDDDDDDDDGNDDDGDEDVIYDEVE